MRKYNENPLHIAIFLKNLELLRLMCELYPSYIDQKDTSNQTPEQLANFI